MRRADPAPSVSVEYSPQLYGKVLHGERLRRNDGARFQHSVRSRSTAVATGRLACNTKAGGTVICSWAGPQRCKMADQITKRGGPRPEKVFDVGIDQKLPSYELLILGLQNIFGMTGMFVFPAILGRSFNLAPERIAYLYGMTFIVCGIVTASFRAAIWLISNPSQSLFSV